MAMTPIVYLALGLFFLTIVLMAVAFVVYKRSFKNVARIARQTGIESDNVIWIDDKFKVTQRNGQWVITFFRIKERTSSIPGSSWTKFLHPKGRNKVLELSDDEWRGRQLSKHIQRGIFFYETIEGQLSPMTIVRKDGETYFEVMTQDNISFLAEAVIEANSLTRNRNKELLVLGGIIAACLVLGIISIFGIIYMNESAKSTLGASQAQCIQLYREINNMTASGSASFLDDVVSRVGG
jgi:hypothetical protein